MKKQKYTYEKSGVNINAADNFVKFISNISSKNKGKKKLNNIGGFGSISSIPTNLKKTKNCSMHRWSWNKSRNS